MSNFSDFISGGLPVGDKLRFGSTTTLNATTNDTTVLNVASGGGVLHHIMLNGMGADVRISNFKVTVDGAAERTLSTLGTDYSLKTNTSNAETLIIPLPISFKTSLVVKMSNAGPNAGYAQAVYTIK